MATSSYCNPLPSFLISERCIDEPGGIIAAGYIKKSTFAAWMDFEDNTEWTNAITAQNVLVAYDCKGTYPGPEVNSTDDTYGDGADSEFQSYSHTVDYQHKGIHIGASGARDNIVAYDSLTKNGGAYHFWFVDSGHKLWVFGDPCSITAKPVVPQSKKEQEYWSVQVKSTGTNPAQTYDAPDITYIAP